MSQGRSATSCRSGSKAMNASRSLWTRKVSGGVGECAMRLRKAGQHRAAARTFREFEFVDDGERTGDVGGDLGHGFRAYELT